ncbi:Stp1/IreP family PP2C-type Ser/Thr phosphatase [Nitrospira sp. Kam-Ns4a]
MSATGGQRDRARPGWTGTGLSDLGKVREENEDAVLVLDELGLWLVADGMGGHPGGDVASRLAVRAVADFMKRAGLSPSSREAEPLLRKAIQHANDAVREESRTRPDLSGMGTTLVALHINHEEAVLAHVGDSRAYLLRDRSLRPLTHDHSFVEEQMRLGLLTAEEARRHPYRHMLTRAVGIEPQVEPDTLSLPLEPDDCLLLCTDGLTKMLEDSEILDTLEKASSAPERACRALVEAANRRGGPDNITVVVVRRAMG